MNIREAKEEISHTLCSYHEKNEYGEYCYPIVRQRPILLMGPPGIGKTAIMEQIAQEANVGLVSYTITHHTRQSAIGLPRIREKEYEGIRTSVTEYTMSEIIDSVYACMERTGKQEGILFIDEINCASETLAPTMLQFLQNKTFGSHRIPEGWMIVAAGNPPQYNKSVREFDIVTLDRIRRIDVEVDCEIWLEYARNAAVHGAILSYLGMKQDRFYSIVNTLDEKSFVTARGWEDLSEMLKSYERLGISVTEKQVIQFLQKEETAADFAAYYQLYSKYGHDYSIPDIVDGTAKEEVWNESVNLAKNGGFEERFIVSELVLSYLDHELRRYRLCEDRIRVLYEETRRFQKQIGKQAFAEFVMELKKSAAVKRAAQMMTKKETEIMAAVIGKLEGFDLEIRKRHISRSTDEFEVIRELFGQLTEERTKILETTALQLKNAFRFMADCFGDGQEMVFFITGLSRNETAMQYISERGCDEFFCYSDKLLFQKRSEELLKACIELKG